MQTAVARAAPDDQDIVALVHAGQVETAFAALLPRYEQRIYRLCCALLRDRAQSEDVAQESLVRIWKALERYDGRAALSTWIYAITRNRCLTVLEQRRRAARIVVTMDAQGVAEQPARASSPAAGPDALESEQRLEQMRALVEALPERQRQVLLLYYFEERSVGEVARMLGCPEGTVKTQLFRGRSALADRLRSIGLDDPREWLEEGA